MGRKTTSSRYESSDPTPTPTQSKIHYSGTPQSSDPTPTPSTTAGSWLPSEHPQINQSSGGVNITGAYQGEFVMLPPKIAFTPAVRELGQELADKLAGATYITSEELAMRFPDTPSDIQAQINELDRIQSAQRLEKVRALPPAETTFTDSIYGITFKCIGTNCTPVPQTPTSSSKSILPFVIIGILAIVVIIILRGRA